MIVVTLAVLILFLWVHLTVSSEPPSIDSGSNFLFSSLMVLILFILSSFITLTVSIDETNVRIKFGYGIFKKNIALKEISSAKTVKNHWYYGWGIRLWLWPTTWIYNISGFDAVEVVLNNGKIYRIGTDVPKELETAITQKIRGSAQN